METLPLSIRSTDWQGGVFRDSVLENLCLPQVFKDLVWVNRESHVPPYLSQDNGGLARVGLQKNLEPLSRA